MKVINKKIVISILMFIEVCSLFLMYKSFNNKNTVLDDVIIKEKDKKELFAIMVDDGNGNYIESSNNTWPTNMIYNEELSGCIDTKGNKIENALTFDSVNNIATLETGSTTYCYLYFDKDTSVYAKLVSDYTNNNGVSLLSETSSDTYPVYYYTGDISNNNIIYADKCWKMVRTTDTGGVKLIYNGEVNDGSCNNTGTSTTIDSTYTTFNDGYNSPAYVGYMYNKVYLRIGKNMSSDTVKYIYGNSVNWDGEKYTLTDTISGTWGSLYETDLQHYHYTCFSTSDLCTSVYYIFYGEEILARYITLTEGKKVEDALNEMLYAEDVNTTNSTIKTKIDSWYESNIKEKTDSNNKLYSDYLENTIYCNNREITSLGGWDSDNGSIVSNWLVFNYVSLECKNKTDQFTLKESAGGTLGYGNNVLDYPIGLLTYKEASLARNQSDTNYLNNNTEYFLLSPCSYNAGSSYIHKMNSGNLTYHALFDVSGIRPALSLSKNVLLKNGVGDGSVNSPYEVELIKKY